MDVIDFGEYDVMCELTPINIMTGQPATDHIRRALELKKHVITANKGPIAWHYRELRDLAKKQGVQLCYEATVMDGVPVYNMAQETLRGCKITEIKGILNATTNFILTEMEKGISYEDAIEEGRRQGFVEADPSMDLDGWDASAKLTALMNVLMDETITPMDIDRIGISGITKEDLDKAAAEGKKIKLLCHGYLKDGKAIGEVKPTLVEKNDMAAIMDATMSYVTVNTDLMGEVTVVEHAFEPEIDHTAYGVLSDLLRILTNTR
jgi:homoserine dehydrogenase